MTELLNSENNSKEYTNIMVGPCTIINTSSAFKITWYNNSVTNKSLSSNIGINPSNNNIIINNYKIIEFIRTIENKESKVQFIKEFKNNLLICLYSNNNIFIYALK